MDTKVKNQSIYHWLIVAACCGMAISAIGIVTNCMGVFYKPVSEALGMALTATVIMIIITRKKRG